MNMLLKASVPWNIISWNRYQSWTIIQTDTVWKMFLEMDVPKKNKQNHLKTSE